MDGEGELLQELNSMFNRDALAVSSCRYSSWCPDRHSQAAEEWAPQKPMHHGWHMFAEQCRQLDDANMRITEVDLTCLGDSENVLYEFKVEAEEDDPDEDGSIASSLVSPLAAPQEDSPHLPGRQGDQHSGSLGTLSSSDSPRNAAEDQGCGTDPSLCLCRTPLAGGEDHGYPLGTSFGYTDAAPQPPQGLSMKEASLLPPELSGKEVTAEFVQGYLAALRSMAAHSLRDPGFDRPQQQPAPGPRASQSLRHSGALNLAPSSTSSSSTSSSSLLPPSILGTSSRFPSSFNPLAASLASSLSSDISTSLAFTNQASPTSPLSGCAVGGNSGTLPKASACNELLSGNSGSLPWTRAASGKFPSAGISGSVGTAKVNGLSRMVQSPPIHRNRTAEALVMSRNSSPNMRQPGPSSRDPTMGCTRRALIQQRGEFHEFAEGIKGPMPALRAADIFRCRLQGSAMHNSAAHGSEPGPGTPGMRRASQHARSGSWSCEADAPTFDSFLDHSSSPVPGSLPREVSRPMRSLRVEVARPIAAPATRSGSYKEESPHAEATATLVKSPTAPWTSSRFSTEGGRTRGASPESTFFSRLKQKLKKALVPSRSSSPGKGYPEGRPGVMGHPSSPLSSPGEAPSAHQDSTHRADILIFTNPAEPEGSECRLGDANFDGGLSAAFQVETVRRLHELQQGVVYSSLPSSRHGSSDEGNEPAFLRETVRRVHEVQLEEGCSMVPGSGLGSPAMGSPVSKRTMSRRKRDIALGDCSSNSRPRTPNRLQQCVGSTSDQASRAPQLFRTCSDLK